MSTTSLPLTDRRTGLAVALDFLELTKPKIGVMELVVVAVAAFLAKWGQPDPWRLVHALGATVAIAASASAFNQVMEVRLDAMMPRTAKRPIPSGRISVAQATAFATVLLSVGVTQMICMVNWQATGWALASWAIYVGIYTPMKTRTHWNTFVGAIAGAIPIMIGWTAVGGSVDLRCCAVFMILFLWQFPHFMAIAWIYRRQYRRAGFQMLSVIDQSGRLAGRQAVTGAMCLLPVSVFPALNSPIQGGVAYASLALVLGIWFLACGWSFFLHQNELSARRLLRASLIYLPLLLAGMLLTIP